MKKVTLVLDVETDEQVFNMMQEVKWHHKVISCEVNEDKPGPQTVWVLHCENEDSFSESTVYGDYRLAAAIFYKEVREVIKTYAMDFETPEELADLIEIETGTGGEHHDNNNIWSYRPFDDNRPDEGAYFSVYEDGEYNNFHCDIWLEKKEVQ